VVKATIIKDNIKDIMADAVVMGIYEGVKSLDPDLADIDRKLGGVISDMISGDDFKGKEGETLLIYTLGKIPAKKILLLGLGKEEDFGANTIRKVIGKAVKQLEKSKTDTAARVRDEIKKLEEEANNE
jgi:leucyl aminopeptidase